MRACVVADLSRNSDAALMSIRIPKLFLLIGGVIAVLAVRAKCSNPEAVKPGWTRLRINAYDAAHPNGRSATLDVPPGSPGAELAHQGLLRGKE